MDWHGVKVGFVGLVEEEWLETLGAVNPNVRHQVFGEKDKGGEGEGEGEGNVAGERTRRGGGVAGNAWSSKSKCKASSLWWKDMGGEGEGEGHAVGGKGQGGEEEWLETLGAVNPNAMHHVWKEGTREESGGVSGGGLGFGGLEQSTI